jgi:hypothetical protein
MRNLHELDRYRLKTVRVLERYGSFGDECYGAFTIPYNARYFRVVASTGEGWDHISVSTSGRTPTWKEMDYIKRLFFKDDEWAYQLHAPPSKHINNHPHCLHIWRSHISPVPTPPENFV